MHLRWDNSVSSFVLPAVGGFIVISGLILGYIYQDSVTAKMNEWKILPQEEPLTELYLNNYLDFPKEITKGQVVPFSFTIHNLEGKSMAYPYSVYLQTTDGTRILVASSSVVVADKGAQVINESYTFNTSSPKVTVFIDLPSVGESLHFVLPTTI